LHHSIENLLSRGTDYQNDFLENVDTGHAPENTKFTYDGEDVLLDDNSGNLTKYQNGPGIDNKLSVRTGTDVKYFLADHLGSTNGLADSSGAVTSQTTYDAFGNPTENLETRYGFTGRENDSFTGLMHYRARQYDPKIGRFISEDPIGFAGGDVNLYGYVRNMPLWFRDPTGLQPGADVMAYPPFWQAVAAAGGAIAAAASSTAIVAGGGLALGVGIGYYPGQWTANHPSNPFVNGPWPFNPFKPPFGYPVPVYPTPTVCQIRPRPIPWTIPYERSIPIPRPTPDEDDCYSQCAHLLPSPSGDLQSSEFRKCYRECMGTLW
jgi:RHS repeat-associated protein